VCRIAQAGCLQSAIVDAMQTHVPMKRLLGVASADNQIFTLEEFNHLKECTECFEAWSDSIDQLVRDGSLISNSASMSRASGTPGIPACRTNGAPFQS
jgi:hypothetical protein